MTKGKEIDVIHCIRLTNWEKVNCSTDQLTDGQVDKQIEWNIYVNARLYKPKIKKNASNANNKILTPWIELAITPTYVSPADQNTNKKQLEKLRWRNNQIHFRQGQLESVHWAESNDNANHDDNYDDNDNTTMTNRKEALTVTIVVNRGPETFTNLSDALSATNIFEQYSLQCSNRKDASKLYKAALELISSYSNNNSPIPMFYEEICTNDNKNNNNNLINVYNSKPKISPSILTMEFWRDLAPIHISEKSRFLRCNIMLFRNFEVPVNSSVPELRSWLTATSSFGPLGIYQLDAYQQEIQLTPVYLMNSSCPMNSLLRVFGMFCWTSKQRIMYSNVQQVFTCATQDRILLVCLKLRLPANNQLDFIMPIAFDASEVELQPEQQFLDLMASQCSQTICRLSTKVSTEQNIDTSTCIDKAIESSQKNFNSNMLSITSNKAELEQYFV